MELVYLKPEDDPGPSKELQRLFSEDPEAEFGKGPSDIHILDLKEYDSVVKAEHELNSREVDSFDPDSFLLFPKNAEEIGLPMTRNFLNYGKKVLMDSRGTVDMAGTNIEPGYISKLPHKGKTGVVVLACNPDNEAITILARGHRQAGDDVHVVIATSWDNPDEWLPKAEEMYSKSVGLEPGEYSFLNIPERELQANSDYVKEDFMGIFSRLGSGYNTVVQICPGKNEGHNILYRMMDEDVTLVPSSFNTLYADAIEHSDSITEDFKQFNPKLWMTLSAKGIEEAMEAYRTMGSEQYGNPVANLTAKLTTGASKLPGFLNNKLNESAEELENGFNEKAFGYSKFGRVFLEENVPSWVNVDELKYPASMLPPFMGQYGLEVGKLKLDNDGFGYQIPQIFDYQGLRELTK